MAVKFGSILEPNNPNTTAIAKTVNLSGARTVETYDDLSKIIPQVLSPSFDPATGAIDTKDAIGQVWYVANDQKYYKLTSLQIIGDKPPFTAKTTWTDFALTVVSSQEKWLHDYIASGVSTQSILGFDPRSGESGTSTGNNMYFTYADEVRFLTGGKYFAIDAGDSGGSEDVNNPAILISQKILDSTVSTIYSADIDPLWTTAEALSNNLDILNGNITTLNGTVNNIISYINGDLADYINDLYTRSTWASIISDSTSKAGKLADEKAFKAIFDSNSNYIAQFGMYQTDLRTVLPQTDGGKSFSNLVVGRISGTTTPQTLAYTSTYNSSGTLTSMDALTITPNSITLGSTYNGDKLAITPGIISMYAGTNMNIQLGTKSENHTINIIPDSTDALYGVTFTNLPLNVERFNFKNGNTLTDFDSYVHNLINNKQFGDIKISNKSIIRSSIDSGEFKVTHAGSNNGFIIGTHSVSGSNIYQLKLRSTNGTSAYDYTFPLSSGNVALESYVTAQIGNLSTQFTHIVETLQESITSNTEAIATNAANIVTNANSIATNKTAFDTHAATKATISTFGHVKLGTSTVISANFGNVGLTANGQMVFPIDTALSTSSNNVVRNSVITAALDTKVNKNDTNIAIGNKSSASGSWSTAVGESSGASGYLSAAYGNMAKATSSGTAALGPYSTASGTDSTAIGFHSSATGQFSTSVGRYSTASGASSVTLGNSVNADGENGVAIGRMASASEDNSIVLNATGETKTAVEANSFNVYTGGGVAGFYIDGTSLGDLLDEKATNEALTTGLATKVDTTTFNTELAKKADKATTLSGYGITDAYTKTATDTALATKANKATTLSGYGITDAYTKTAIDTELAKKADATTVTTELAKKADKATTLAGYGITDAYTKTATDTALAAKANKATTLSGYGITDAYTKTATDTALATKANKATTLSGYGITDAYTKTELDGKLVGAMRFKGNVDTYDDLPSTGQVHGDMWNVLDTGNNYAWNSDTASWDNLAGVVDLSEYAKTTEVTSAISTAVSNHNSSTSAHSTLFAAKANKATTLAGYGITDAYTKTAVDTELAKKADTTTVTTELAKKANKATTLSGYGITDAYTSDEVDTELAKKANTATTLAGYGITDAYTKTATDTALAAKANKATTLSGYGITDAYTKTTTDTALAKKQDKLTAGDNITISSNNVISSSCQYVDISGQGNSSNASGTDAIAIGDGANAAGNYSVAIGDDTSSQCISIAIGSSAKANEYGTTAIGTCSTANDKFASAFGAYSSATGDYSMAIGNEAEALSIRSMAIGCQAKASAESATAIGTCSAANNLYSNSIGAYANATGEVSIAIGYEATASGSTSMAIGCQAKARGTASIIVGNGGCAIDVGSVAFGGGAKANGPYTTAIGTKAEANIDQSVAIGAYAIGCNTGAVAIGINAYAGCIGSIAIGCNATAKHRSSIVLNSTADAYPKCSPEPNSFSVFTDGGVDKFYIDGTSLGGLLDEKATTSALTTGLATKVDTTTFNTELAKKADKATTLSGYGITDAYTKTAVDTELAKKADSTTVTTELAKKADKATALAGYGITDAYTKTATDTALATKANKATTLSGYGITDAYTKTTVDTELAKKANKATTLSGYGITDAYTKTELDGKLVGAMRFKGNVDTYDDLPSTGQVHGDMWNVLDTGNNYAWNSETSLWDNLAGVVDLSEYAKTTEVTSAISTAVSNHNSSTSAHSTLFAAKADKATTLAGYGITDAYTKTAVDTELNKKATTDALTTGLATKIDKNTTSVAAKGSVLSVNSVATIGNNAKNYTAFGRGITDTAQTAGIAVSSANKTFLYENSTEYSLADILADIATAKTTSETNTTNIAGLTTTVDGHTTNIATLTTTANNALSKTVTTQQSVASEVKFNGGIRADAIKTLYGTSLFTTVSAKGFDYTGIYRLFPYQSTTAFFESTVAGGSNTLLRATTIYENGVSLANTYAKIADTYTKTETDSAIATAISSKNKTGWSPEFTTSSYDSTEEAYKWEIGSYTIPAYSNATPIVQIYEDPNATGTALPTGVSKFELVQPKIAVSYNGTGDKATVTAYFNFESADLPIVASRFKAQVWFPGIS